MATAADRLAVPLVLDALATRSWRLAYYAIECQEPESLACFERRQKARAALLRFLADTQRQLQLADTQTHA